MNKEKPSVKEELRKIKESRKEQETETFPDSQSGKKSSNQAKQPVKKTEHKQPARRKKP